jgi:hypothetical protein
MNELIYRWKNFYKSGDLEKAANLIDEIDNVSNYISSEILQLKTKNEYIMNNTYVNNIFYSIGLSFLIIISFYIVFFYIKKHLGASSSISKSSLKKIILFIALFLILSTNMLLFVKLPFEKFEDKFFALGILGRDKTAEKYYPDSDSLIPLNTSIRWYVYLNNEMNEMEYVRINVKIVDDKYLLPNSTTCMASPVNAIYSFTYFLNHNETILMPFEWALTKINRKQDISEIKEMKINNETIPLSMNINIKSTPRVVFELYLYDIPTQGFTFKWGSNNFERCSWTQILISPEQPRYDPRLYMPFDTGAVPVPDESGNGNHGIPQGGVAWQSDYGGCYSFDGVDDYINEPAASGFSTSQLTFTYWSKQAGTEPFFMHPIGLFGGHRATTYVSSNSYVYCYKFSRVSGSSYEGPIGTLDSDWHHFAVVFDGNRLKVYVDGVGRVDVSAPGTIDKIDDSFFVGTTGVGASPSANWFSGLVDEVRVYSRVLSAGEVQESYDASKAKYIFSP